MKTKEFEKPEGYFIEIHQSIIEPMLVGGCPREIAVVNSSVVAAIALGAGSWWCIPIGIIVHIAGCILAKFDPDFVKVLPRFLRMPKYLEI